MKKIDTEKSLTFDRRIDSLKESIGYLNSEGYFSNYEDFSDYRKDTLSSVLVGGDVEYPYDSTLYHDFNYFIPEDKVVFVEEEKKLRPFKDIKEFLNETKKEVGTAIRYRNINNYKENVMLFNGYTCDELVLFGIDFFTFKELFERFEYFDNDTKEWKRFGVEE